MNRLFSEPPRLIGVIAKKRAGKDTLAAALAKHGYRRIAFADRLYEEVASAYDVTTAFLRNDATKETDLPELALRNCKDQVFVEVGLIKALGGDWCADILAFLDSRPLGHAARERIEMELAKPRSPRWTTQTWGTEYKRMRVSNRYWLEVIERTVNASPGSRFIITDTRFLNETDCVYGLGGITLRIRRKKIDDEAARGKATGDPKWCHPSETELDEHKATVEVENREGDPDFMAEAVCRMFGLEEPQPA